jgi:hypothetical protein
MNHSEMLPGLEVALRQANAAHLTAVRAAGNAEQSADAWRKQHEKSLVPDPQTLELPEIELEGRLSEARQNAELSLGRLNAAKEAQELAKRESARLHQSQKADEGAADGLKLGVELDDATGIDRLLLEWQGWVAGKGDDVIAPLPPELALDTTEQWRGLLKAFQGARKEGENAEQRAIKAFGQVKDAAGTPELRAVEKEVAEQICANDFQAAVRDADRLIEGLKDRIGTTRAALESMKADFEACVNELVSLAVVGAKILQEAATKRVPVGAPMVGGKPIVKMRANIFAMPVAERSIVVQRYLDQLIDSGRLPETGSDLLADVICRMHDNKPLGIMLLKMVHDESDQYVAIDKISNSGGEGVVMAMLLFCLISQVRAEIHAKLQRFSGGPLLLDNPFAKATSASMWKAQCMMAQSIGVQLVFLTAIQDYNALGEFSNFIRLRSAGKNTKTGRSHVEVATLHLNEPVAV